MKTFCFTIDDNIRFLQETARRGYESIFDHPYPAMLRRLHDEFGLKIQLNLFYECDGFNLAMMPDRYKDEWSRNADWLKLSFHSRAETEYPYIHSSYDEVYNDCKAVQNEIVRFASRNALAETTTVHYCQTTNEGLNALKDNGVAGLLGLFGNDAYPQTSYSLPDSDASKIRSGAVVRRSGIAFAGIDIVLNLYDTERIIALLQELSDRKSIKVMIHEQYFYPDYPAYQSDFEQKLNSAFAFLTAHGYTSKFLEDLVY